MYYVYLIQSRKDKQFYTGFTGDLQNRDLKATPSDFLDARTNGGKKGHPSDPAYWENMFAVCEFAGGKLKDIMIHAIDQGFGRPRPQRGRPVLADGEVANRVIDRVA